MKIATSELEHLREEVKNCHRIIKDLQKKREFVGLTNEVKRELIKNSALWDMHIHIGWYSAPAKSFVEKTIQLIADIEAAHGITTAPEKGN